MYLIEGTQNEMRSRYSILGVTKEILLRHFQLYLHFFITFQSLQLMYNSICWLLPYTLLTMNANA
ncbi:unnamed protein product [Brugia timori]|uniref:Ovule protein n=1 Tax=Brugia timori TaxID=42155 RepID=A0A0R3Q6N4_9BILA|nr:unnamed protein product [Brugia timori]